MSTTDSYYVTNGIKIRRKEGDTGSVPFLMDDDYSLVGKTALFQVRDFYGNLIFSKSSTVATEITINSQIITVLLDGTETVGYDGNHYWELQIYDADESNTMAEGRFYIKKQYAKLS